MTCCAPVVFPPAVPGRTAGQEELGLVSRDLGEGRHQVELVVPGVHCANCIRTVEAGLQQAGGVEQARVNLSTRRVSVVWRGEAPPDLFGILERLGFPAHVAEPDDDAGDPQYRRLVAATAVAGFCSMNIMLLSVSVWSGADAETRQAFHWIAAALALPCLVYSGRVFFESAWSALRHRRTNMDVPISVGICLAFLLSLYDTVFNGPHAYFDAVATLVFFLLIGRTLDHAMREKARSAVQGLVRLVPRGVNILDSDGHRLFRPIGEIEPGMLILLAAGDRVPVDGVVAEGTSEFDCALATGESRPVEVTPGGEVRAGTLNLSGPVVMRATARAQDSFLAEMLRLMEAAEGGRAGYRRLADRAARLYSPVVHSVAFLAFLGWMAATGDWHLAVTIAVAVLIITCPCALGLAVPIVQVVAARRLFDGRIMVRDGSALERIAEVDTVVFDKTGTLTLGRPRLVGGMPAGEEAMALAVALAGRSNHPYARAIAAEAGGAPAALTDIVEHPGLGLEGRLGASCIRLGRAAWASEGAEADAGAGTVLARDGRVLARFRFEDALRPQAVEAVEALRRQGLRLLILSGDAPDAVGDVARALGIAEAQAAMLPAAKVEKLAALAREGRRVLMVGDGLNDAPALAAAHVSMAPGSAADIGRNAADFVFLRDGLDAVPLTLSLSRATGVLVRQNLWLSVVYNLIALPVAIAGAVTPLIAAVAMSLSSIVVVANALRLRAPVEPAAARRDRGGAEPGRRSLQEVTEP